MKNTPEIARVGSTGGSAGFSKASDLKEYIGRRVEWEYAHDRYRGTCLVRTGRLERIEGRNIVVDGDYFWFADIQSTFRVLPNGSHEPRGEQAPN